MKLQAVTTPEGLILYATGPMKGCRHDWKLYLRSELYETLDELIFIEDKMYCWYGDFGYNTRAFLEVPFQGFNLTAAQKLCNRAMAGSRATLEWMLKEIKLYWTTVDFKRKLRVGESSIRLLYIGEMLLTNLRSSIYPNSIAKYFKCLQTSLEE